MKKQLIHFLNWMNRKAADEPMNLETDNEDIALMYLREYPTKQGNCPTCNSECEIGGKDSQTRYFIPIQTAETDWEIMITDLRNNFVEELKDADVNIHVLDYLKKKYSLKRKVQ